MLLHLCVWRTMVLSVNMVVHNKIKQKEGGCGPNIDKML
jgi:hypothetical protein